MRGPGTSSYAITATTMCDASAAMETAGPHTASVKSSATTESTATAASGEGIVWNQTGSDEDERCQSSENISKHGFLRHLGAVHRWSDAARPCVGT
jgi:hypothetical protein